MSYFVGMARIAEFFGPDDILVAITKSGLLSALAIVYKPTLQRTEWAGDFVYRTCQCNFQSLCLSSSGEPFAGTASHVPHMASQE